MTEPPTYCQSLRMETDWYKSPARDSGNEKFTRMMMETGIVDRMRLWSSVMVESYIPRNYFADWGCSSKFRDGLHILGWPTDLL